MGRKLNIFIEPGTKVKVIKGRLEGRKGITLPYGGCWVHILFRNKEEAYLPSSSVSVLKSVLKNEPKQGTIAELLP